MYVHTVFGQSLRLISPGACFGAPLRQITEQLHGRLHLYVHTYDPTQRTESMQTIET